MIALAIPLSLSACAERKTDIFAVGGGNNGTGGGTTVDQRCPNGMTELAGVQVALGETDQTTVDTYPGTVIVQQTYDLDDYCIGIYPLPGSQGQAWTPDGLSTSQLPAVEELLAAHGRRLCTVGELLYGAAGDNNWRHVDDKEERQDSCDPDNQNPSQLGSFSSCVSPTGLHDYEVRSSWALLDDLTAGPLADSYAFGFPGDGRYAAYGGNSETNTVYAPSNFGIHFHDPKDSAYIDDGVRICADPGGVNSDEESDWSAQVAALLNAGTFADWLAEAGVQAGDTGG